MSFKKILVLTCSALILSSSPLFAKTFSLKVKSYQTENSCSKESERCDLGSMSDQLMDECQFSGYRNCVVTEYESNTSTSYSFGCGEVEKTVCKVKVKGTNLNSI